MLLLLLISSLAATFDGPPSALQGLGRFDTRALPEASGVVRSRRHPGIFWVHNDSGNAPTLFAIRRDGSVVREFRLGMPNLDWEDISADDHGHLYVGDIGNNGGLMAIRAVYQFDEPDPSRSASEPVQPRAAWFYRFPVGGRFDAEGLFLEEDGKKAIIISKRADGQEAELFSLSLDRPAPLLRPAVPRRIGILPGFVEPATGGSLSADGRLLAACAGTVTRIYERGGGVAWRPLAEVHYPAAPVEGIAWDGLDLILVSEGRGVDRIAEEDWRRGAVARSIRPAAARPAGPLEVKDRSP